VLFFFLFFFTDETFIYKDFEISHTLATALGETSRDKKRMNEELRVSYPVNTSVRALTH